MRLIKYSHSDLDDLFKLTPFSVGFDSMFDRLLDCKKPNCQNSSYPPYDIVKLDDFNYEVRIALAGFSKDNVEVEYADGRLKVESKFDSKKDSEMVNARGEEEMIVYGISKRNFRRVFTLADDMVVHGAHFKDGRLSISIERIVPEEKKPRTIDIK